MKTNQLMQREFMGDTITQRTKDSFINATELLAVYNSISDSKKRFKDFWEIKSVSLFIEELEKDMFFNGDDSAHLKTHQSTRGRNGGTWMHPYLFVKFAMWLSPKFELNVIKWVYDGLIDTRHNVGNHYKEMTNAITKVYVEHYKKAPTRDIFSKEADFLNLLVYGSEGGGRRNNSTKKQLTLLDDLQKLSTNLLLMGDKGRKEKLLVYAQNFKLING